MRKRCLFGIQDDLHAYAERMTADLQAGQAYPGPGKVDAIYGPVRAGLLHREGRFQTELVEVEPNTKLPVHRHPGVDTIECPLHGFIRFRIEGRDPYPHIPDSRLARYALGKLVRIDAKAWHAGTTGPEGASFLSMQRWPEGAAMTLLGECWEGELLSERHARHVGTEAFDTVPATLDHADYIASRLRKEEVDELWALAKAKPRDACRLSVERSVRAWTWRVRGEPAAMFGVATRNLIGERGEPWLLTTPAVDRHPVRFLRSCSIAIDHMKASFPVLENWVDARHTVCVRWLKWMGFTVHDPIPYGVLQLPFHRFEFDAGGIRA